MSKKNNKKKNYKVHHIAEENNDVIYGAVRTYTGSNPGMFLQKYTNEISKSFEFGRPVLPIYGKLYCMDFTETEEPILSQHVETIAYLLLQKLPIRVFLDNNNCIFVVSPYSQTETLGALDEIMKLVLMCMN